MSKCCPGGPNGEDHLDGCAFNPKNIASASYPDAREPKTHDEQKRINSDEMKRFAEELRKVQGAYAARTTKPEQNT